MARIRTYLGLTGGALGLVGLIVTPASACLNDDNSGSSVDFATESFTGPDPVKTILFRTDLAEPAPAHHAAAKRVAAKRVVVLDSTTLLQAKLDKIAARTAADTAQWDGVRDLSPGQWRAAKADLHAAKRASWLLATLDRADAGTAAQESQVDALEGKVAALATHLKTLIRAEFADRFGDRDGFRSFDRSGSFDGHKCDRDGHRDGSRDRHWDGDGSRA
jgi:hypothetical protein